MKGNIMDKKILLGGAAALIMAGSLVATPASASIELSFGGEAKLTANFNECGPAAAADTTIEARYIIEVTATLQGVKNQAD